MEQHTKLDCAHRQSGKVTNTVRCMQAVWAWPAVLDYMISYRAYMYAGVVKGQGGVLGVVLLRVGAFPIRRACSDQQLASSETHARAPAGVTLSVSWLP